jgi:hypothetical protein
LYQEICIHGAPPLLVQFFEPFSNLHSKITSSILPTIPINSICSIWLVQRYIERFERVYRLIQFPSQGIQCLIMLYFGALHGGLKIVLAFAQVV